VEWRAPPGFRLDEPGTWPEVDGRIEYVGGRIQYMPPCGEEQQDVASDVTALLHDWIRSHPDFVLGSNEAGMLLEGEVRGADAAIWRRADVGGSKGFRRVPPVLAVEIAGEHEREPDLEAKVSWYLARGVLVVWLVLPDTREVVVRTAEGMSRRRIGKPLPAHPALPGLTPDVAAFFWQLDRQ
jgi:Uma2 family endonuclease